MKTSWERFLRWRKIWGIHNDLLLNGVMVNTTPKKIALKEMTKYLVESDREYE